MKKSNKLFCYVVASLLGCLLPIHAETQGFSGKVNGDVYGQIRVIEDVDGDGSKDLIFGGTDGKVHLFSSKGKEIFRPPYWPKQVNSPITSSIEIADLDGNGTPSILVSTLAGTVYCLNSKGKEIWKKDLGGKFLSSPPLPVDFEGDGKYDILLNSNSGNVTLLSSKGFTKVILGMDNPVSATPVVVDSTKDGTKNIIIKDSAGKVVIADQKGNLIKEWQTPSYGREGQWPFGIDAADVDRDGNIEIFTTTTSNGGGQFYLWNTEGKVLSTFQLSDAAHGAPQLADMDGDGVDEFVIAQADGKILICDKSGKVRKGWPYTSNHDINSSPTIIDIDGDGYNEIVFTANTRDKAARAGYIMALDRNGKPLPNYPKYIGKSVAPLTFADLDGDGTLEMIAAGGIGYTGPQIHLIKTQAPSKFKLVVLRQETFIK